MLVEIAAVTVPCEGPDVVSEDADRPAATLPGKNPGGTRAPLPSAEQLIGSGRQQKDWPHSHGEAIECSARGEI